MFFSGYKSITANGPEAGPKPHIGVIPRLLGIAEVSTNPEAHSPQQFAIH